MREVKANNISLQAVKSLTYDKGCRAEDIADDDTEGELDGPDLGSRHVLLNVYIFQSYVPYIINWFQKCSQ